MAAFKTVAGSIPRTPQPAARSRPRWPLVVLAVLLVGGLGGGVFWALSRNGSSTIPVVVPAPGDATVPVEQTGVLDVDSIPTGALVTIGDKELGPGPRVVKISAGSSVHVKLVRHGYMPYENNVAVEANKTFVIRQNLVSAPAMISVESDPPGAAVLVDGQAFGTTPLTKPVPVGTFEVKLSKPGYDPITLRSDFIAGETTTIKRDLKASTKFGFATIRVSGVGWADVYLGNKLLGRNKTLTGLSTLQLPTGRHTLRLVNAPANKEQKLVVDIEERKTKSFTVAFN